MFAKSLRVFRCKIPTRLLLLDTFSGDGKSLINTGKTIQWWVFQLRLITGGFSHIFSACLGLNPCFTRDSPCWQKNDRNLWAVLTS